MSEYRVTETREFETPCRRSVDDRVACLTNRLVHQSRVFYGVVRHFAELDLRYQVSSVR